MTSSDKQVAVLGAGAWGMNLVRTFHGLGALAAVVETDPVKRAKLGTDFPGVPVFSTLSQVHGGINAVAIATPAPTHFDRVREALELGLDVFVEKPFTLSSPTAHELKSLAEHRGRVLMVGHLLLYQPAIRFLSDYLRAGKLGRVFSIHQERLNMGRVRDIEDALWSLGVHDIAVLLDLVGPEVRPLELSVHKQPALQSTIADDCFLHMWFDNGIHSHLHVSWLWPEKSRRTVVVGERGILIYEEGTQTVLLHKKTVSFPSLEVLDAGSEVLFQQTGEPLKLELEHFLERCVDRRAPLSGAASACQVVEILEAASKATPGLAIGDLKHKKALLSAQAEAAPYLTV